MPEEGPGLTVEGRPVQPGQEQACVDEWVYGTDGRQIQKARTDGRAYSQAVMEGRDVQGGGKVTGKVKVPLFGELGYEGGGQYVDKEATTETWGTNSSTTDGETRSKSARPGLVEKCNTEYRKELDRCDSLLLIYP
jgi:hypothetical protein